MWGICSTGGCHAQPVFCMPAAIPGFLKEQFEKQQFERRYRRVVFGWKKMSVQNSTLGDRCSLDVSCYKTVETMRQCVKANHLRVLLSKGFKSKRPSESLPKPKRQRCDFDSSESLFAPWMLMIIASLNSGSTSPSSPRSLDPRANE